MSTQEMTKWKEKTLVGVSLKVLAPTGQHDPTKLINWSANRWAFKPEVGYSHRWGHWVLDAYAAVWFYTTNSGHGVRPAEQTPVVEVQLQQRRLRKLWRELSKHFYCLAAFMGRSAQLGAQRISVETIRLRCFQEKNMGDQFDAGFLWRRGTRAKRPRHQQNSSP